VGRKAVPLVVVDRPTEDVRFDHVILDNRKAMRELADRLVARGHDRLLFVCRSRSRLVTQHRIEGLEAARRHAMHRIDVDIIEAQNDEAFLREELARSLRTARGRTALIVSNSHQASLVLGFLRELGVSCPQDVSVVAFDDPEWSRLVTPPLSVVRQPAPAMAQAAWDLLMQRVNRVDGATRTMALEAAIELRESVPDRTGAAHRVSDVSVAPVGDGARGADALGDTKASAVRRRAARRPGSRPPRLR
jgi:LacI family transcriptional regulator